MSEDKPEESDKPSTISVTTPIIDNNDNVDRQTDDESLDGKLKAEEQANNMNEATGGTCASEVMDQVTRENIELSPVPVGISRKFRQKYSVQDLRTVPVEISRKCHQKNSMQDLPAQKSAIMKNSDFNQPPQTNATRISQAAQPNDKHNTTDPMINQEGTGQSLKGSEECNKMSVKRASPYCSSDSETAKQLCPVAKRQHTVNTDDEFVEKTIERRECTFPMTMHQILAHPGYTQIISWTSNGKSWKILNKKAFEKVLPRYFVHSSYSSFQRAIYRWGFTRNTNPGPERNTYRHELFIKSKPRLCERMKCLPKKVEVTSPVVSSSNSSSKNKNTSPGGYCGSSVMRSPPSEGASCTTEGIAATATTAGTGCPTTTTTTLQAAQAAGMIPPGSTVLLTDHRSNSAAGHATTAHGLPPELVHLAGHGHQQVSYLPAPPPGGGGGHVLHHHNAAVPRHIQVIHHHTGVPPANLDGIPQAAPPGGGGVGGAMRTYSSSGGDSYESSLITATTAQQQQQQGHVVLRTSTDASAAPLPSNRPARVFHHPLSLPPHAVMMTSAPGIGVGVAARRQQQQPQQYVTIHNGAPLPLPLPLHGVSLAEDHHHHHNNNNNNHLYSTLSASSNPAGGAAAGAGGTQYVVLSPDGNSIVRGAPPQLQLQPATTTATVAATAQPRYQSIAHHHHHRLTAAAPGTAPTTGAPGVPRGHTTTTEQALLAHGTLPTAAAHHHHHAAQAQAAQEVHVVYTSEPPPPQQHQHQHQTILVSGPAPGTVQQLRVPLQQHHQQQQYAHLRSMPPPSAAEEDAAASYIYRSNILPQRRL